MSIIQALILGIVQGLTEFLPISSSGHLVLVPWLFGWELEAQSAFVFNVLVQLGTMLAVIAYFSKDLVRMFIVSLRSIRERTALQNAESRFTLFILLSTAPAIVAGLLLKSSVKEAFSNPIAVSIFLIITAAILFASERLKVKRKELTDLTAADALWIGVFQGFALFPGLSRSGVTISAGIGRGFEREDAARFSFLMALPVMFGAGAIALVDLFALPEISSQIAPLVTGFLTAALVGYLSISWLMSFLVRRGLNFFSAYCFFLGISVLLMGQIRG
ncbi:MAG: undecaprenyl-diphosphatase UppP [Chloroflexi bacterium]|nr:undecaprenyl-diphosphatase UppP [Chloroflexota bacterium]